MGCIEYRIGRKRNVASEEGQIFATPIGPFPALLHRSGGSRIKGPGRRVLPN